MVVDTNVLLYAANPDVAEHAECRAKLMELRASPAAWYLTWGIAYEFVRVATHPRVWPRPWTTDGALGFLEALLAAPGAGLLVATGRHLAVLREVERTVPGLRGNLVHDAHTAVLMREHGVRRICTRDTDFHRFPFVEVVDPLQS